MPAINRETFVWNALGTKPAPGDEIYTPGEQPIASYDNWWNWAVSTDIQALDDTLADHNVRHEADGPDELNIGGLPIDYIATLRGADGTHDLSLIDPTDDSTVARVDMDADLIYEWPSHANRLRLNAGAQLGGDIVRQDTGEAVYNYATGKVSHAEEADHAATADHADVAANADALDGYDSTAFLRPSSSPVTITGTWAYDQTIGGDISGNAATADHADAADSAAYATQSGNSDTVDGYHAQQLIDLAKQSGEWNHITTTSRATTGSLWEWTHQSATTYDRYRLTIYHESHQDTQVKAFFWLKIGQNGVWDERDTRYEWRERDLVNDRSTEHASHGWTIASCWAGDMSVSTYVISCPTAVASPPNHYPVISAQSDEMSREVPRAFDHGHLATSYPQINSFKLRSAYPSSTGKIVLEGQNLG